MDDKKAEILKAALVCFARYGFDKTTLDDIGKIAGLNKASLYYYYKNKETLYTEAVFSEAENFLSDLKLRVSKKNGVPEKILEYLENRMRFIVEMNSFHQLSLDSFSAIQPLFEKLYGAIMEREAVFLKEILDDGVNQGQIVSCDTRRIAVSIIAVAESAKLNSPVCRSRVGSSPEEREAAAKKLSGDVAFTVSLILNGLKI